MTRNFPIIHAPSLGRGIGSRQRSSGGADSRPRPGSIAAPTDQAVRMATLGPTQKFSLEVMVIAICKAKTILRTTCLSQYRHCLGGDNRSENRAIISYKPHFFMDQCINLMHVSHISPSSLECYYIMYFRFWMYVYIYLTRRLMCGEPKI
jgi:hypothetical protein